MFLNLIGLLLTLSFHRDHRSHKICEYYETVLSHSLTYSPRVSQLAKTWKIVCSQSQLDKSVTSQSDNQNRNVLSLTHSLTHSLMQASTHSRTRTHVCMHAHTTCNITNSLIYSINLIRLGGRLSWQMNNLVRLTCFFLPGDHPEYFFSRVENAHTYQRNVSVLPPTVKEKQGAHSIMLTQDRNYSGPKRPVTTVDNDSGSFRPITKSAHVKTGS